MKIKISEFGGLFLEKRGKMRKQYCMYRGYGAGLSRCGEWCPKFEVLKYPGSKEVSLRTCRGIQSVKESDYTEVPEGTTKEKYTKEVVERSKGLKGY